MGPRRARIAISALLIALGAILILRRIPGPSDARLWLEDFDVLQGHMSEVYANLEWVVEERELDLHALREGTRASLARVWTRWGARRVLQRFVDAFDDPHLRIEKRRVPPPSAGRGNESNALPENISAEQACEQLGYRNRDLDFRLKLDSLDGFETLPQVGGNPFAAGTLTLTDGRRFGVVRIAHFGEDGYLATAIETWEEFRKTLTEPCGPECQSAFHQSVAEQLLAHLEARIRQLDAAGIEALVVDITGNGGGTDWASIAPELLTTRSLRCTKGAFIRHSHWSERLPERIALIERDLSRSDLEAETRRLLHLARGRLETWLNQARTPCDRSALWERSHTRLECSQLVREDVHMCGILAEAPDADLTGLASEAILYQPSRWQAGSGAYSGPVIVVIDRQTASASEHFTALLQANDAATVIGERSMGAGCGYTNGGAPVFLENTRLLVRMPDCIRYRGDGANELAGIEPDIPVAWEPGDSERTRARKLLDMLTELRLERTGTGERTSEFRSSSGAQHDF
jgi:hypothetical protein